MPDFLNPMNDSGHLLSAGIKAVTYGPSDQVKPPDHFVEIEKVTNNSKVIALTTFDLCS